MRARGAKLVHRVLVERLDFHHFGDRDVRHFFERREALADEDVRDLLVDVELVDEERAQARRLGLLLLLRFLDAHQVQLPARHLRGEAHVLAAAADRDRQVLLVDDDVHRVPLLVDDDALHLAPAPAR